VCTISSKCKALQQQSAATVPLVSHTVFKIKNVIQAYQHNKCSSHAVAFPHDLGLDAITDNKNCVDLAAIAENYYYYVCCTRSLSLFISSRVGVAVPINQSRSIKMTLAQTNFDRSTTMDFNHHAPVTTRRHLTGPW